MAKMTPEQLRKASRIQLEIGMIFEHSKTERIITMSGHVLHVPVCCWPQRPGYEEIIELKRKLKRIKDGRENEKDE